MATHRYKRQDRVVYRASASTCVEARVKTLHKDGDITVEPWFFLDGKTGERQGGFVGGKVRLQERDCAPIFAEVE